MAPRQERNMESSTMCGKQGGLPTGRSSAAVKPPPTAVAKTVVRLCRSADGIRHHYSRHLLYEKQQKGKESLVRQKQRQQKHLKQQQHTHTVEQKRHQQPHARRKLRQPQQQAHRVRQLHKQLQPPSYQQKEQQPTQDHLPQTGHFFGQYTHEARHPARVLMAVLLLVVTRVPLQRTSPELPCGVCLASVPAVGAVAVIATCASLPPTAKNHPLFRTHSSRAAPARRLANEKGFEGQSKLEKGHTAGAQRDGGGQVPENLPPGTKPDGKEGDAGRVASPAPQLAGHIQQAARDDEVISPETKRKAKATVATQHALPVEPSTVTATKNVNASLAHLSRSVASTAQGGTAYAAADKGAAGETRGRRRAEGASRSRGVASPASSEKEGKGTADADTDDLAPEVFRKLQQSATGASLQQKVAASAQQQQTSFETKVEQHRPRAPDRVKGVYVSESDSSVPTDVDTLGKRYTSSSQVYSSDTAKRLRSDATTSATSADPLPEPATSSPSRPPTGPPDEPKMGAPGGGALLPDSTASSDSPASVLRRAEPASGPDGAAVTGGAGSVKSGALHPAADAQLPAEEVSGKGSSPSKPSLKQTAKPTRSAGATEKSLPVESPVAAKESAESANQAPEERNAEEPCELRQRLVEQRVAVLEEQTRSADKLIQDAADKQQRMFTAFEERVQAITEHLTAVQKGIDVVEQRLASLGEHLASERDQQLAMFQENLQTYIDATGLKGAALRQAELSGKLSALHNMHDTLSDKVKSLAHRLEDMEEKRQARLELATNKLQNVVEGRTSLAIAQLVTDAKQCAAGMQQLLNDAKLDQMLLAQAVKEAEERLREQRFAAVDLSHVDESMSFRGITSAFAALLQAAFPQKELVLIYFVTVRPQRLADVAYANVFLVPSAENTRRLLSAVAADPSLLEMVVKVESVMAEAWRVSPKRAHVQYLTPTPQEGLRMADSVDFVYEFMKTMHKVTHEEHVSGEITEGRPGILVYTGMRRGVEAPADTPYTEFRKLQILRYLVTMYTSPVQETARLWQIMKNEVQLLDIFAPLQPVEVEGCHLRVYGGLAPLPEIPNSPFIKGGIMFVRLELTRSGTRYSLFPSPTLWLKILQHLALADRTNVGTFAVIKTHLANVSWIRSRVQRLFQSPPVGELAVYVHSYQRTTQPSELQAAEAKRSEGKSKRASYATREYHKGLAEVVEHITDTLAQSVLPYTARQGFTMRRHLFVHVCETDVSCGTQESTQ